MPKGHQMRALKHYIKLAKCHLSDPEANPPNQRQAQVLSAYEFAKPVVEQMQRDGSGKDVVKLQGAIREGNRSAHHKARARLRAKLMEQRASRSLSR